MVRIEATIFLLLFTLAAQVTFAQVVNIEKKRKENDDGFAGIITAGFFFIDNGKNINQFKNTIDLQYRKNAHTIILINDLSLMTVDDDELVNGGFQHLRYNYTIKDSSFLTLETFAQHQYNTIKLLEQRFLLGAGPRFRIVNSKKISFYIGAIAMYEYEQRSDSLRTHTELARFDSYISFVWNILDNLRFNNIMYYQPSFMNLENYRISSESSLNLKITDALSFKVGIQTNFDSQPPEDIQKLFYFWENSLKYEF